MGKQFIFKLLFIISVLGISSCTKQEEKIIPGNTPPPDNTLPTGLKANFINKSYIGLLGREPSESEYNDALNSLNSGNFNEASRSTVISNILENDEFYTRQFEIANNEMLNGLDTFEVNDVINTYTFLLTQPQYEPFYLQIQSELDRLYIYKSIPTLLSNGQLTIQGMHRICVNNYFFDQINMGSLNFVIAAYQLFLLRNPTEFEKTEGVKIIDGFTGVLFLQEASSKNEFIDIFLNSTDYAEGQVKQMFNRFLFRSPNTEESVYFTQLLKQNLDFKILLVNLLKSDEYAGIE
ncbi:MAG: hypothetical protein RL092_1840 [Bacteroidota bacterium]|jgi:hypothetical protein